MLRRVLESFAASAAPLIGARCRPIGPEMADEPLTPMGKPMETRSK